jgi:L-threonylcarbamoyladenylate synthase
MIKISHKEFKTAVLDPTREGIKAAIAILKNDGLVALPTETVYGLAGNARSALAVSRIYQAKNRPQDNPLIWHVHDLPSALKLFDMRNMSAEVQKRIELLAAHFWPGALTIVAAKSPELLSDKHDRLPTIAVRVPSDDIALKILKELDFPLAMPSANASTRPSPTSYLHVLKTLDGRIDAVIKGGKCRLGLESSVLRVDEDMPQILRAGLISAKDIASVLGENVHIEKTQKDTPTLSPGTKYLHYSPKLAQVLLLSVDAASIYWSTGSSFLGRQSDIRSILMKQGVRAPDALSLALGDEPHSFAQELYNALYRAEERPEQPLVLLLPPKEPQWEFVIDRLKRASGDI